MKQGFRALFIVVGRLLTFEVKQLHTYFALQLEKARTSGNTYVSVIAGKTAI